MAGSLAVRQSKTIPARLDQRPPDEEPQKMICLAGMATVKVLEEGELQVPAWGCVIPYEVREITLDETEQQTGWDVLRSGQQRPEANDKFVESAVPNSCQARLSQAVRTDDHLLQPPKTFQSQTSRPTL
jgi:hypothetical protein